MTASPFGSGGAALRFPGEPGCGADAVPTTPPLGLLMLAAALALASFLVLRRRAQA